MDKRAIRVGNWARETYRGYEMRISINDMPFYNQFEPILIEEKYLSDFKIEEVEGKRVFYRDCGGKSFVSIQDDGIAWRVSVHAEFIKIEGTIRYMHELQNLLEDSHIYLNYEIDTENPDRKN